MYDENSMKKHIFWLKARRIFFIILFTAIGSAIGAIISSYFIDILLFTKGLAIVVVAITTSLFLSIALLITANTGKEVADGYWKIAVYKKLAIISKKLDNLEKINEFLNPSEVKKEQVEKKEKSVSTTETEKSPEESKAEELPSEEISSPSTSDKNEDETLSDENK